MTTLLAVDIGGTKTLLALYQLQAGGELELLRSERYLSADWDDLAPMLATFLGAGQPPQRPPAWPWQGRWRRARPS